MLISTGIPSKEDIANVTPPAERLARGPVVMIECFQEIPCNPCVAACSKGAITMSRDINSLPVADFQKCNGCSVCVSRCPGLAIFVVDQTYGEDTALVKLPFEYVPAPKEGQYARGLNRAGESLGWFKVNKVTSGGKKNMTQVISLEVPRELAMEVRNIEAGGYRYEAKPALVCRCEDITLEQIQACIADGCRTIDEIKYRTRAGMGPCQGRTCRQLIAQMLSYAYNIPLEEVLLPVFRVPAVPIPIEAMADACVADKTT